MNADELLTAFSNGKMVQWKRKGAILWNDFYPEDQEEDVPHAGEWMNNPTDEIEWRLKPRSVWL